MIKKYLSREKFSNSPLAKLGSLPEGSGDIGLYKFVPLAVKEAEEKPEGDGAKRIAKDFVISTEAVDRDNDTIARTGWQLDAYQKNGAVLWAHDSSIPNIAAPFNTRITDVDLRSGAVFPTKEEYEFGALIGRLVDLQLVKNTSVGFIPKRWVWNEERGGFDFVEQELAEFSIVPVGSNPETMEASAAAKGLDLHTLHNWGVKFLDNDATACGFFAEREHVEKLVGCLQKQWGARTVDAGGMTAQKSEGSGSAVPPVANGPDPSEPSKDAALIAVADALEAEGGERLLKAAALLRAEVKGEDAPEPAPPITAKMIADMIREEMRAKQPESLAKIFTEEMTQFTQSLRRELLGRLD